MYTITRIARFTQDSQGNPLTTKDGRNYERVRIQVAEKPDIWISGFGNSQTKTWDVGSKVDIEITQNGEYWNFKTPNKSDQLAGELASIKTRLAVIEGKLGIALPGKEDTETQMKEEIPPEDIPF